MPLGKVCLHLEVICHITDHSPVHNLGGSALIIRKPDAVTESREQYLLLLETESIAVLFSYTIWRGQWGNDFFSM